MLSSTPLQCIGLLLNLIDQQQTPQVCMKIHLSCEIKLINLCPTVKLFVVALCECALYTVQWILVGIRRSILVMTELLTHQLRHQTRWWESQRGLSSRTSLLPEVVFYYYAAATVSLSGYAGWLLYTVGSGTIQAKCSSVNRCLSREVLSFQSFITVYMTAVWKKLIYVVLKSNA